MLLAIECVHKRDMIHRDIKPANIFIEESSGDIQILKIGEFGSARLDLKNAINNGTLSL
jgi:serine/threonine protein kinase